MVASLAASSGPSPASPVDPLRSLSGRDRRLFDHFGRGPAVPVPYRAIQHAFEAWARAIPDATAAEHLGTTITYAELDRQADRLAHLLAANGVCPGDFVALFLHRSIPMLVGILAILKSGAAYVPLHLGVVPPGQLRHVVDVTRPPVILTLAALADQVAAPGGQAVIAVDTFLAEPDDGGRPFVPARPVAPDDPCYVLFTSGTTGRPNGVVITHRNVCNVLLTSPGDLGLRPGWRVAQILSIAFDMAAWEILGSLSHGCTLVIRGSDIQRAVSDVDVVIATPSILARLDPRRCSRVKVVAVAGEPCSRSLAQRWAPGRVFYNACGPTETTIVNTVHRYAPRAGRVPIGRPTPNNTVYILNADGSACGIGEIGEMWAGGECVGAGYLAEEELTAARFVPDPFAGGGSRMFRTRDLARWTPDGELEHWGRTDDQIKIRGFRVELDAVTAVLESVPGCSSATTVALDGRTLVAFVCPETVDPELARQAVAEVLPYYCTPSAVHPLASLPITSRGKVDKAALLDRARVAA